MLTFWYPKYKTLIKTITMLAIMLYYSKSYGSFCVLCFTIHIVEKVLEMEEKEEIRLGGGVKIVKRNNN